MAAAVDQKRDIDEARRAFEEAAKAAENAVGLLNAALAALDSIETALDSRLTTPASKALAVTDVSGAVDETVESVRKIAEVLALRGIRARREARTSSKEG